MQSHDNIHVSRWPDVSLKVFPNLLFDWSELTCRIIPMELPEVNKEKCMKQQSNVYEALSKCAELLKIQFSSTYKSKKRQAIWISISAPLKRLSHQRVRI